MNREEHPKCGDEWCPTPPRAAGPEHPHGPQAFFTGSGSLPLGRAYRTFALKRPLQLSWTRLYHQFGVNPSKAGEICAPLITFARTT